MLRNRKKDVPTASRSTAAGSTITATYEIAGMTCGHCVTAVTDELTALPGVDNVRVDLNAGGISTATVASKAPLELDTVSAAVEEAGYQLMSAPK